MAGIEAAADAERARLRDERRHQRLVDAAVDVEPLVRHADLAGADEATPDDAVGGGVYVGVVEHEQGVLAAELERRGDEALRRPAVATSRPVAVLPVKRTASACPTRTGPRSVPTPVTTCSTSRGTPASQKSEAAQSAVNDVC